MPRFGQGGLDVACGHWFDIELGGEGRQLVAMPGERPQPNTLEGVDDVANLRHLQRQGTFHTLRPIGFYRRLGTSRSGWVQADSSRTGSSRGESR